MNQWLTTNDPIVDSLYAGTGYFWYYTWLNVWLDFTCNGTGSEVLSFSEYSCPSGYVNYGMSCRTGSTVAGGPCVYNTDCTVPWVCAGWWYSPPVTPFRYNDWLPWNASHPHWNDQPHAPSAWDYCREWDEGWDADPDPGTPVPCWYYPGPNGNYCGWAIWGWGCGDFVPMEWTTTYGTCSTSSSSTITATETIVTETVACTGTWWGCVPNWTCNAGFSLTWDTNGNGTPNCVKTSCVTTTGGTTLYEYTYDWTQPGPISVNLQANEDGYSQSCAASFFIVLADIPTALSSDVTVNFDAIGPGGESCPGQSLTIPGGSTTASVNVACGCAIANGGNLNMTITSVSPSFIDGLYFDIGGGQYFQFNTSTGLDITSNIQNCGCDTNGSDNCAQPTITETSNPTSYCYDTVWNFPLVPYYIHKIYGYSGTTMGWGQTICTTQNEEATDLNNCSWCGVTTESPTVCDINDPLMAGVCYIPGGFGSTLIIKEGINAALGSPMPMVGINTSDPHEALDVNGIVRSAQVLTLSDARLKTSIEKIDSALEKIRQINGYSFEWKKDGKPDFGVLAQEIEKIFKNAVNTDVDGLKTVQYTALLAPIIEAIHEINTQIETLSNEKFDAQSKRIEAIEAKIQ